jgi:type IV pilus assembly protein PilB
VSAEAGPYLVSCWSCLGEFDAAGAVWCSDDPKNPTKLCPFCFRCFCDASAEYKQAFWSYAPAPLVEELKTLSASKDRLGDVLIRLKKLTTTQLLEALVEQQESGQKLGRILVERGLVQAADIEAALQGQGTGPLLDTQGVAYASSGFWEKSSPQAILDYLLLVGARRGASDVSIEPQADQVAVRYRIDGSSFRLDSIPRALLPAVLERLGAMFRIDASVERAQVGRGRRTIEGADYDLIVQTVPGPHGPSVTLKLINRSTFLKDFTALGVELNDRVRLIEELNAAFGLVLVTSPAFNGAVTTAYSVMNFLVRSQRNLLSLESPIFWRVEGARQMEVEVGPEGPRVETTLRTAVAVRPEVLMLCAVPDRGTAVAATQLASSLLVIAVMTAQSAAQAVVALRELEVSPQLLAGSLGAVTCQRLVRKICTICRVPAEPPAFRTLTAHGIVIEEAQRLKFFKGRGCPSCHHVGYRGRQALFEVMSGTPDVRTGIVNNRSAADLEALAADGGMRTLRQRCLELVREGVTTFDEFARLKL